MKLTYSAGGIVINQHGQVLLINEGGDFWGLPRGRIDPGEDTLAAARREIWEESGLTHLTYIRKLGHYQRHPYNDGNPDTRELKTITLFLFTTTEPLADKNEEDNETIWASPEQAADLLTEPHDKQFFASKMSDIVGIV